MNDLFTRNYEAELLKYLPDYMQEYREIQVILNSEKGIVEQLWKDFIQGFKNNFINYADETGIELFENMMGIKPNINDSLEVRRENILIKWNSQPPYTWWFLKRFLNSILGEGTNEPIRDLSIQELRIITHITTIGTISSLYDTLRYMIPANMTLIFDNKLNQKGNGGIHLAGCVMASIYNNQEVTLNG
jgi:hypothetical protein